MHQHVKKSIQNWMRYNRAICKRTQHIIRPTDVDAPSELRYARVSKHTHFIAKTLVGDVICIGHVTIGWHSLW